MLSQIQGSLMGVMIGDAMGMPVELMTAEQILEQTGGEGIKNFSHPIQRKIKDTEKLVAGSTTDDWQLTEAILTSLTRRAAFDITDIALAHVEAYETSTFGWGGTTRGGLKELQEYFKSFGKAGRSPFDNPTHGVLGLSRGCGNGVAMKIAPVALHAVLTRGQFRSDDHFVRSFDESIAFEFPYLAERVAGIGRLTHSDPRSWAAAYAVALLIAETMVFRYFTSRLTVVKDSQWVLKRVYKKVRRFEAMYPFDSEDTFSKRIEKLLNPDLLFGPIEELRKEIGVGCIALESVCFAIAVFLRNPLNFRLGILEAVNSGGDTDTTAAMAGAMIGSVVGIKNIPKEWTSYNSDFDKAIVLGESFLKAINRDGS